MKLFNDIAMLGSDNNSIWKLGKLLALIWPVLLIDVRSEGNVQGICPNVIYK